MVLHKMRHLLEAWLTIYTETMPHQDISILLNTGNGK